MTSATAELQRRSFEIAMQATERALAKGPRERCPMCGGTGLMGHDRPCPHCDGVGFKDEPELRQIHGVRHREDEEPFACLTCEDTGEIEVQQRNSAGHAFREPWLTRTIPCPDCNADGAR